MIEADNRIREANLGERICDLKRRQAHGDLIGYLESALASGEGPAELQARICNELGLAHLQTNDPCKAEAAFGRALEIAPESVNPRFNKANLALYAREYKRALEEYLDILARDPNHNGARYHAGLCCAMMGRCVDARLYFIDSATADPDAMGPHFWAGESLLHAGDFERALRYFRRAVELTPEHPESLRGIAICLYELEEYSECISYCDMLIWAGGGAEFTALRIKGDALLALGEAERAAMCHLDMTFLDFDARDYLVRRAERLAAKDPTQFSGYVASIISQIPELEPAIATIRHAQVTTTPTR